jgi:hypothetical protein
LARALLLVVLMHTSYRLGRSGCGAMREGRAMRMIMRKKRRVTLLELIEAVQDTSGSDDEVVAVLTHLLKSVRTLRPMPAVAA